MGLREPKQDWPYLEEHHLSHCGRREGWCRCWLVSSELREIPIFEAETSKSEQEVGVWGAWRRFKVSEECGETSCLENGSEMFGQCWAAHQ